MTCIAAVSMVLLAGAAFAVEPGEVLPGPFSAYIVAGGPSWPRPNPCRPKTGRTSRTRPASASMPTSSPGFGLDHRRGLHPRGPDRRLAARQVAEATRCHGREEQEQPAWRAFGVFLRLKDDFLKDDDRIPQARAVEVFATKAELKLVPLALDQAESARTKTWKWRRTTRRRFSCTKTTG